MPGKQRNYSISYKLSALEYLKFASVERTAKEFKVDSKRIRKWRGSKKKLENLHAARGGVRKRIEDAGRKLHSEELERRLVHWVISKREERLRVSRKMILQKAAVLAKEEHGSFAASNGWLQKFLRRNSFVLRRGERQYHRSFPVTVMRK